MARCLGLSGSKIKLSNQNQTEFSHSNSNEQSIDQNESKKYENCKNYLCL